MLIICYGNIYRSAFVEAYIRARVGEGVELRSAGFHAKTGRPAPARHVEMCRQLGVDLAGHRSSQVTTADLAWADTIVLMDRHNWQRLMNMGAVPAKFVWLGALDADRIEIPDPHDFGDAAARAIVHRLAQCSRRLAEIVEGAAL